MDELALSFFPLPHVLRGERREGVLIDRPEICSRCDRQCETSRTSGLQLCSYGLNYIRVDDELLIAGIVVRDYHQVTPARQKRMRELGRDSVTKDDLDRLLARLGLITAEQAAELRARMDAVIDEYRNTKSYQQDVVELLRPELGRTLSQVHDYKQFVQQIVQNMNVLLETKYPGATLEDKLEKASHEETAIYWTAVLMDEKIDAALYLDAAERIAEPRDQALFRLHGLVLKYVRIYKSDADRKELTVRVRGESWAKIEGNARAIGIIPHTMIDNAFKYAPTGTRIEVVFEEIEGDIVVSVESFGPEIRPDEVTRIFDLFFRAEAARRMSSEGTGFGLASAQNIARAHDTEIVVRQNPARRGQADTVFTTFSIRFPIASDGHGDREKAQRRTSNGN